MCRVPAFKGDGACKLFSATRVFHCSAPGQRSSASLLYCLSATGMLQAWQSDQAPFFCFISLAQHLCAHQPGLNSSWILDVAGVYEVPDEHRHAIWLSDRHLWSKHAACYASEAAQLFVMLPISMILCLIGSSCAVTAKLFLLFSPAVIVLPVVFCIRLRLPRVTGS